jgi:hypothetical protein
VAELIETVWQPIDSTRVGPGQLRPVHWDRAWASAWALSEVAAGIRSAKGVIASSTEVVRAGHSWRTVAAAKGLNRFGLAAVTAVPALIKVLRENAAAKVAFGAEASAAAALG